MKLEPAPGISIDLDERFRSEVKSLPGRVTLEGDAMCREIASRLLARHASGIAITQDGALVHVCSAEEYGARALRALLSGEPFVGELFLLRTLPEALLRTFAEKEGIPIFDAPKDDARLLLDRIAREQPQTFYSLARSVDRLLPYLREAFPALPTKDI